MLNTTNAFEKLLDWTSGKKRRKIALGYGHQVRLILQIPRVGGTLFSRILGCDPSVLLLSEVHPSLDGADIRKQLEAGSLHLGGSFERAGYVELISRLMKSDNRTLIVRDHTHKNFTLASGNSYELESLDVLEAAGFEVLPITLVRHPADQYLSCLSREGMVKYMTIDHFCKGYVQFANKTGAIEHVRYEDVTTYPHQTMQKVASVLRTDFIPESISRFSENHGVSGDRDQPSRGYDLSEIQTLRRRSGFDEVLEEMGKNRDLREICDRFGYTI